MDIPPPCLHLSPHHHDDLPSHPPCTANLSEPFSLNDHSSDVSNAVQSNGSSDAEMTVSLQQDPAPMTAKMQRQKSLSRRMLSRVKQGIASKSKISQAIRPTESETSLARRLSGRRKQCSNAEYHSQSFEISGSSVDTSVDERPEQEVSVVATPQRSCTDSTVSTEDILGDTTTMTTPPPQGNVPTLSPILPSSPPMPSSPSPQPTPRPPRKASPAFLPQGSESTSWVVPCVDLKVNSDHESVDIAAKREVWIVIEVTVKTKTIEFDAADGSRAPDVHDSAEKTLQPEIKVERPYGTITSLRLCFKPVEGCRIRDIVGQKVLKDLTVGQQCSLFIKLQVPKIRLRDNIIDPDQDSLFTELESIVGTLETEILHVEARYRHSMLPSDNVVTVRHICKLKRPKAESRWSIARSISKADLQDDIHTRLARYLASQYPATRALELIREYFGLDNVEKSGVHRIRSALDDQLRQQEIMTIGDTNPSLVVTDIDMYVTIPSAPATNQFSTAPSTPLLAECPASHHSDDKLKPSSISLVTSTAFALPLITAPKTTTALTTNASSPTPSPQEPHEQEGSRSQDTARQLWHHIRRTSLSAKQLEEMTPERLRHLEASDEILKELRQKALANKRSVGAETLKAWKWEGIMRSGSERQGEAPWM